ncbi:outer membrane protein assembly factor BamB family protein [Halobiforma nitratireducens]|uniref:Pyrrolo-quinoline quinone repeat domain-containing protein n=1 Tax=Halobiforma nitratireducens JCM 10879 TaxID=1227454 RepID=M0L1P3_9EURY|nr:PQQ-binding-like beta-propeller repeat protein [Halobiforma nitratireducens]EMA27471.1 hypothetical protein C446_17831 [Halobiforma nitratireducens JCM 10879]
MPARRALLAACGTVVLAGCIGRSDDSTVESSWPGHGYDSARTGTVDDRNGPEPPLTAVWSRSLPRYGGSDASPLLADGTVYVAYTDGPFTGPEAERDVRIEAFDAVSGDSRWTTTATTTQEGGSTYHHADSLALADNAILVQTADGLCAVDTDGSRRWCFDNVSDGQLSHQTIVPGVGDDAVYTGHYRQIATTESHPFFYAVDLETGEERWRHEFEEWDGQLVFSPAVADGVVYLAEFDDGLTALDTDDGSELWRTNLSVDSAPTVTDGAVFVTYADLGENDEDHEYGAAAVEADTGEIRWRADEDDGGGWIPRHLAATGDTVYYVSDGRLIARDTATGDRQWDDRGRQLVADDDDIADDENYSIETGTPAVVDDRIYVGGDGVIVIDRYTGEVLARVDVADHRLETTIAVADDWLYANVDAELYGISECRTELFGRCLR